MAKLILTYGTFDLFHTGHVRLLRRARALGAELHVGLSTDEFNARKGKTAIMTYAQRKEILESCRHADHVFSEKTWEQKADDILRLGADTLVMGDDWLGKFDEFSRLCNVTYLTRTEGVSTTYLRNFIRADPKKLALGAPV